MAMSAGLVATKSEGLATNPFTANSVLVEVANQSCLSNFCQVSLTLRLSFLKVDDHHADRVVF